MATRLELARTYKGGQPGKSGRDPSRTYRASALGQIYLRIPRAEGMDGKAFKKVPGSAARATSKDGGFLCESLNIIQSESGTARELGANRPPTK